MGETSASPINLDESTGRVIVKATPSPVALVGNDLQILEVSASFASLFGLEPSACVSRFVSDFLEPSTVLAEAAGSRNVLQDLPCLLVSGSGDRAYAKFSCQPLANSEAFLLGISPVGITGDDLSVVDQDTGAFFESAPFGICSFDENGRILWMNAPERGILGVEEGKDKNYFLKDFFEDAAEAEDFLRVLKAVRQVTAFDARLKSGCGQPKYVSIYCRHYESNSSGLRFRAFMLDITEQKLREGRADSTARLASRTLDSLSAHICILDSNGVILAVNKPWMDFAIENGAPEDYQVIGINYLDICRNTEGEEREDALRFVEGVESVIQSKMAEFSMVYPCHSATEPRWFIARVNRFGFGDEQRIVITHENITDRKLAEQENTRLLFEVSQSAAHQRQILKDVLANVTDGRLKLCESRQDLPHPLSQFGETIPLTARTLRSLRRMIEDVACSLGFAEHRWEDMVTAAGEAAMNAVVHAEGGQAKVCAVPGGPIQIWIEDCGRGIAEECLHRATLERGFTTSGSFGHGFSMMHKMADRVWLLTSAAGTTIVLEQERHCPHRTDILSDSMSVFKYSPSAQYES